MAVARIQPVWDAALADAGLDRTAARLYLFAGAPAHAESYAAAWYPPGERLYPNEHQPFSRGQLDDANSVEHIDLHRIHVFAGAPLLPIEGWIRHEVQHAVQWDNDGQNLWELRAIVNDALGRRLGGIAGSAVLYNLLPSESNANGAARRFLVARHGGTVVNELLATPMAALVREVEVERGLEKAGLQHVCFAAVFDVEVASEFERRRTDFDDLVSRVDPTAPALWNQLRDDLGFQELRRRAADAEPLSADVADLDSQGLFEAWGPARELVQLTIRHAYDIAGL